ncbi:disulfide bond formation protein B [Piscirickettsia salmonis]|uniref:disulfide bond formation protein B n=1 Tax=Piscirickettsia salmonis TaxID=1238 RepID=UPI0012B9A1E8|nr:disulfide bond formation protein B [Piscirickettsia salmonis]
MLSTPWLAANALLLCALSILLIMAFYFQLTRNELPCPLCLLQRLCFIGLGSVALLNIIYGLMALP